MDAAPPSRDYRRELLRNQIWQGANFASKAAFLVVLTPLMLQRWGPEQFGLFALASSLLVSMALLDGGVRNLTRLRLVEAERRGDDAAYRRAFAEGVLTFASVVAAAAVVVALLASTGALREWFRLPANGSLVLVVTVVLTGVLMISLFGLEPLAAKGRLSSMKAANTWGALAAIPVVAGALWLHAGVLTVLVLYSACLIVPNLVYAARDGVLALRPWTFLPAFGPRVALATLRDGGWFYLTTVALIVKTHALTFVVAAMAGPAEAGVFYILLRLTEIVGNVGATASETSLAELAAGPDDRHRGRSFRQSWSYVALFSLHAVVALVLLGRPMLELWLAGHYVLPAATMFAIGAFGLAGAFSRVVVNAAMGLNAVRPAALANCAEAAVDVGLAALGYYLAGLPGLFVGGAVGVLCLLPVAGRLTRFFDAGPAGTYLRPLGPLLPGLALAAVLQGTAAAAGSMIGWGLALAVTAAVALLQLRRLHRAG